MQANQRLKSPRVDDMPLFQLDVNVENLRKYLENFILRQDQQEKQLQELEQKFIQKSSITQITEALNTVGKHSEIINDQIRSQALNRIDAQQFIPEPTADDIQKQSLFFSKQQNIMTEAITIVYKKQQELESQNRDLQIQLEGKLDAESYNDQHQTMKKRLLDKIDSNFKILDNERKDLDKKITKQISDFEKIVRELEKKTLWKIQDCQDLLQKRVNQEYVQEVVRISEESILEKIAKLGPQSSENQNDGNADLMYNRLNQYIKDLENTTNDKFQTQKSQIQSISDQLSKKFTSLDRFNDFVQKQQIIDTNQNVKIKNLENQVELLPVKFNEIQKQYKDLREQIDGLELKVDKVISVQIDKDQLDKYAEMISQLDPHKICQIESDIRVLYEKTERTQSELEQLSDDIRKKYNINDLLDIIKEQHNTNQLTVQDVNKLIQSHTPKSSLDSERLLQLTRDIGIMQSKMESITQIERRVNRMLKESDISNLKKQVKSKLEEEAFKKEVFQLETKISQLLEQYSYMKKDLGKLGQLMQRSNGLSTTNQQIIDTQSLITTKQMPIGRCLACGSNSQNGKKVRSYSKQTRTNNYLSPNPQNMLNQSMEVTNHTSMQDYKTYATNSTFVDLHNNQTPHILQNKNIVGLSGTQIINKRTRPISSKK